MSERGAIVARAIRATLDGDSTVVADLFAPGVTAMLPAAVASATALAIEIEDRARVFDDVTLEVNGETTVGDTVWIEWTASVRHVGPFAIDDTVIPPSGRRTMLHGATVAEFADDRISRYRQYADCAALLCGDLYGGPAGGAAT